MSGTSESDPTPDEINVAWGVLGKLVAGASAVVPLKYEGVIIGEAEVGLDGTVSVNVIDPDFLKKYFGDDAGRSFSLRVANSARFSFLFKDEGPGLSFILS